VSPQATALRINATDITQNTGEGRTQRAPCFTPPTQQVQGPRRQRRRSLGISASRCPRMARSSTRDREDSTWRPDGTDRLTTASPQGRTVSLHADARFWRLSDDASRWDPMPVAQRLSTTPSEACRGAMPGLALPERRQGHGGRRGVLRSNSTARWSGQGSPLGSWRADQPGRSCLSSHADGSSRVPAAHASGCGGTDLQHTARSHLSGWWDVGPFLATERLW
jgi:hypothetical protein